MTRIQAAGKPGVVRRLLAMVAGGALVTAGLTVAAVSGPAVVPASATPTFQCTSGQGYAYFVNSGSGSVSIVYTGTNKVVGTVNTGGVPYGVGVTPNGREVYVAGGGTGVSTFNTTDFTPTNVAGTFRNAVGAIPSADGTKMFVSNIDSNYISVIDTATNRVTSTISLPGGSGPGWMDIDPSTGLLWVAATRLYAINTSTNAIVRTITTPANYSHAVTVGGGYVWAATQSSGTILRYNAATGAAAGSLALPGGTRVHGLGYDPLSGNVLATLQDGTVRVFSGTAATMTQLRSFTAGSGTNVEGGGARTPVISPFGQIYIASAGSNVNAPGSLYTISRPNPQDVSTWTIANSDTLQNNPDGHTPAFSCMPPLSLDKSFSPASIPLNGSSRVTFKINNTNFAQINSVSVADDLPNGMLISNDPNPSNTCQGTVTAPAGGNRISLTGGSLAATQIGGLVSCEVSVNVVTSAAAGTITNTIPAGALTADPLPPSNTASSGTLRIQAGPSAADDTASTARDTTVTISPLANDTPGLHGDGTAGTFTPSSVILTTDGATDGGKTLVVDGEGTWTVNPDGTVSFDPLPDFTGTATPVGYSATDDSENTASATITTTVRDRPVANDDTATTDYNTPVTVSNLTGNDVAGAGLQFDATTVRLLDADGNKVTTLEVPDEGTYRVNTTTGAVTFTPLPTFTGQATAVPYTVNTTAGDAATANLTVTVSEPPAPTATNDSGSATYGKPVELTPLANDDSGPDGTEFDPATVRLIDPDSGAAVTTLTVPDEGVWSIDTATGKATFTPATGFTGETTPVTYQVQTNLGDVATATLTATIGSPPEATADTGTARFNRPATVDVLANDTPGTDATLDAASVRLIDGAGNPVSTLTVDGKGTWTVNATTGAVVFTPVNGFSGTVDVPYSVTDSNGDSARSTVTVTVNPPPTADNDTATTPQNTPRTVNVLTNDEGGSSGLDTTSVRLIDPDSGAQVTTLTVPDEGTYTVDPDSGAVTFTPVPTFSGTATPVRYSAADNQGTRDTATLTITVTAAPAPTGTPDTPTAAYNTPITFNPTANDTSGATTSTFVPGSVRLIDPTTGQPVTRVSIDGEGTYTVDEDTGEVTFTPVATFRGTATPIGYTASTTFGEAVRSTITPTIGAPGTATATDDAGSGKYGAPVTLTPLTNDSTGDAGVTFNDASLRLVDPATGNPVTTVTVAGEGTWQLDTATGQVTFTPVAGFEGPTTPVRYQVETSAGDTVTATLTVTTGAGPTATPDSKTVPHGSVATVDVLGNDTPGTGATKDPASVRFVDGVGNPVTTLEVPGKGVWTVNPANGQVTFTPVDGFTGTVTAPYQFTDTDGNTAASTVSVTVAAPPAATPDAKTGPQGKPVTLRPLSNDARSATGAAFDPATLRLIDPATGTPATRVVIAGQGVWTVNADGVVTFTPEAGFTGVATPLDYTAADADGVSVRSAITVTITPTPPVAQNDVGSGKQGQPVTINPLGNDQAGTGNLDPTSVRLISPDGTLVTSLQVPGEGTYTVNTTTGAITFTPEPGFTGKTTVRYSVANTDGVRAAASVTFTIAGTPAVPGITPNPPSEGGGATVTLPGGGQLAFTGTEGIVGTATAAVGLVLLGLVLAIIRRRRSSRDTNS